MLVNLPTFSQCGQTSQFLQAWEVVTLFFSDKENRSREVKRLLQSGGAKIAVLDFLI